MSRKIKPFIYLLIFLFFCIAAASSGQNRQSSDVFVNWTESGILAAMFAVILGAFKAVDVIITRRRENCTTCNDPEPKSTELKYKFDQVISEIKLLANSPNNRLGEFSKEILGDMEEVRRELDRHFDNCKRNIELVEALDTALARLHDNVEQLIKIHTKTDNDGIPLVYAPRSWHETQRDTLGMLTTLAANQRDLIEIVRSLQK